MASTREISIRRDGLTLRGRIDCPHALPAPAVLFLKTGVCGGFTTFSTFSLEAVGLLESGQWLKGGGYVLASVALCLAGVVLGRALVRSLAPA